MADLDVITQMEETARRRKLLNALSQSSQDAPLVGKGGRTQAALKVVSALLNQYSQGKLGEQDASNRAQYNQQLGQETNSYLDRMQGKPGQVLSDQQASALMNNDQNPGPLAEPIQRNPREAMVRALTSNLPEMQQLGRASMANMGKEQISPKDILGLPGFTPASRLAAAQSGGIVGLQPEPRVHVINGQLVRDDGNTPQVAGDFRDKFAPPGSVATGSGGAPIIGQLNTGTGEAKFAPGGTSINIDTMGNKEALGQVGKVLGETRQNVIEAKRQLDTSERIYKMAQDPQVMTGFGAGVANGLAAAGAALGFNGPDAPAKTQALMTELAGQTLQKGQTMKGSFSDKDIEFLKQVSAGSISLTPEVLQHVAGLSWAASHNIILDNYKQYAGASEVKGADEIVKMYPMPNLRYSAPDQKRFRAGDDERMQFDSPLLQQKPKGSRLESGASGPTVSNW